MKKLFSLLLFIATLSMTAQTTIANKLRVNGATENNDAVRVVVQDATTKDYHWILKSSLEGGGGAGTLNETLTNGNDTNQSAIFGDPEGENATIIPAFGLSIGNPFSGVAAAYFKDYHVIVSPDLNTSLAAETLNGSAGLNFTVDGAVEPFKIMAAAGSAGEVMAPNFAGSEYWPISFSVNGGTSVNADSSGNVDLTVSGGGTITEITGTANEVDISSGTGPTVVVGLPNNVSVSGSLSAATYASDASVSDAELKFINSLTSNAQTQLTTNASNIAANTTAIALKADKPKFLRIITPYAFTSSATLQKIFNVGSGGNGERSVDANSLYQFKANVSLSGLTATSNALQFGILGTASIASIQYVSVARRDLFSQTAMPYIKNITTAAASTLTANSVAVEGTITVSGTFTTGTAGTIIPAMNFGGSLISGNVDAGTYFEIQKIGADTDTSN